MPVEPLVATRERVALLWEQLTEFPVLRAQLGMETEARFWDVLQDRRAVFLEIPAGLVVAAVRPGHDAVLHVAAFDHDLHGKDAAFRDAIAYLFRVLQLERVSMETPASLKVLIKLAGRLGFTWEGVRRKGWAWGGVTEDVHLNGLLAEEWRDDSPVAAVG